MSWKDLLLAGMTMSLLRETFTMKKSLLDSCEAYHIGAGECMSLILAELSGAELGNGQDDRADVRCVQW
jgi:hypothetical protein